MFRDMRFQELSYIRLEVKKKAGRYTLSALNPLPTLDNTLPNQKSDRVLSHKSLDRVGLGGGGKGRRG